MFQTITKGLPLYVQPPNGYNSVLGYLEDVDPEALALLFDPVKDTAADDRWLNATADARGIPVLVFAGVNHYPDTLLAERIGF